MEKHSLDALVKLSFDQFLKVLIPPPSKNYEVLLARERLKPLSIFATCITAARRKVKQLKILCRVVVSASISYDFGPDSGLITYAFPDGRQPDMQNDLLAMGFITSKDNGILFRVESSTSSDYLQLEMVIKNTRRLKIFRG
jgi:hypothetical protein